MHTEGGVARALSLADPQFSDFVLLAILMSARLWLHTSLARKWSLVDKFVVVLRHMTSVTQHRLPGDLVTRSKLWSERGELRRSRLHGCIARLRSPPRARLVCGTATTEAVVTVPQRVVEARVALMGRLHDGPLFRALAFLGPRELAGTMRVSHKWHTLAQQDRLWAPLCLVQVAAEYKHAEVPAASVLSLTHRAFAFAASTANFRRRSAERDALYGASVQRRVRWRHVMAWLAPPILRCVPWAIGTVMVWLLLSATSHDLRAWHAGVRGGGEGTFAITGVVLVSVTIVRLWAWLSQRFGPLHLPQIPPWLRRIAHPLFVFAVAATMAACVVFIVLLVASGMSASVGVAQKIHFGASFSTRFLPLEWWAESYGRRREGHCDARSRIEADHNGDLCEQVSQVWGSAPPWSSQHVHDLFLYAMMEARGHSIDDQQSTQTATADGFTESSEGEPLDPLRRSDPLEPLLEALYDRHVPAHERVAFNATLPRAFSRGEAGRLPFDVCVLQQCVGEARSQTTRSQLTTLTPTDASRCRFVHVLRAVHDAPWRESLVVGEAADVTLWLIVHNRPLSTWLRVGLERACFFIPWAAWAVWDGLVAPALSVAWHLAAPAVLACHFYLSLAVYVLPVAGTDAQIRADVLGVWRAPLSAYAAAAVWLAAGSPWMRPYSHVHIRVGALLGWLLARCVAVALLCQTRAVRARSWRQMLALFAWAVASQTAPLHPLLLYPGMACAFFYCLSV